MYVYLCVCLPFGCVYVLEWIKFLEREEHISGMPGMNNRDDCETTTASVKGIYRGGSEL